MKETGIWTWGHVIYDYKSFFENMKKLGMNKITIWNDFAPLNSKSIIDEAHRNGIKVVWGFAWGWDTDCRSIAAELDENKLNSIGKSVISVFNEQYRDIAADGIYFQSFTELDKRSAGSKSIAEFAVELVNSTANELLKIAPDLNIEFGLHATSVKDDLDIIARTDRRVGIIWEDLGAFPFAYDPFDVKDYDETYALAERVINLRGDNERCGFITKGMTKLDWSAFVHATEPLVIGVSSREFIEKRQLEKNTLWDKLTVGWRQNLSYAEKMFDLFKSSNNVISVQALIEDGMFENEIKEPAYFFSKLCNSIIL